LTPCRRTAVVRKELWKFGRLQGKCSEKLAHLCTCTQSNCKYSSMMPEKANSNEGFTPQAIHYMYPSAHLRMTSLRMGSDHNRIQDSTRQCAFCAKQLRRPLAAAAPPLIAAPIDSKLQSLAVVLTSVQNGAALARRGHDLPAVFKYLRGSFAACRERLCQGAIEEACGVLDGTGRVGGGKDCQAQYVATRLLLYFTSDVEQRCARDCIGSIPDRLTVLNSPVRFDVMTIAQVAASAGTPAS
jgi:hypothetical protein